MQYLRFELVSSANSQDLGSFAKDFLDAGEDSFSVAAADPDAYLARVRDFACGRDLPPDRVPGFEFWLLRGDRLVANSRLRLNLIPKIELDGGHISYNVRPSERRRGYGSELLRRTLAEARSRGLHRALLTTSPENTGSIGVMISNGAEFVDHTISPFTGERLKRFAVVL